MSGQERLETLASITFPSRHFDFKYSDLNIGNSTKDYITPYSFNFKKITLRWVKDIAVQWSFKIILLG